MPVVQINKVVDPAFYADHNEIVRPFTSHFGKIYEFSAIVTEYYFCRFHILNYTVLYNNVVIPRDFSGLRHTGFILDSGF